MAQLCGEKAVQDIQTAQTLVEDDLRGAFDDIRNLQTSSEYLQNVDKIQQRSGDLENLLGQRDQLKTLEQCARECACTEEQNSLVQQYAAPGPSAMQLWPSVLIIFLAFAGFILAAYLNHKKNRPEPMVCPLKGDCAAVIRSEFSNFFGIGVEKIGMVYYLIVALAYGSFLAVPNLFGTTAASLMVGLSMAAFLFSLYLTFIQLGFLKQICTWCLLSATLTTIIFLTAIVGSNFAFLQFLNEWQPLILVMQFVGLALGVGGATFTDVFFFKFLKDLRISHWEADTMRTISQVTWLGLGFLVLGTVGLAIMDGAGMAILMVVAVIAVTEAFLNLKITPHLIHISFGDDPHKNAKGELRRERRLAFALGAISMVSWYSALILAVWQSIPLSFPVLMLIYIGLLAAAVLGSQIVERTYGRKPMSHG